MSNAVLVAAILDKLALKDQFGRLDETYLQFYYNDFYETLAPLISGDEVNIHANVDAVMIKMHRAGLVDLEEDEQSEMPMGVTLRREGLNLYRQLYSV
jgi:hypothetical protein